MKSRFSIPPFAIWLSAALFYLYQFILRVSPSVMLDDLMIHFGANASEIGALSAIAMYSYSLLQIPSGFLADVLGARKVILGSILLCIVGILIFISSNDLLIAKVGRCLLGAGSAAAFLCVGKISTQWFSVGKRTVLLGMTMAAGTIGALNGGAPLLFLTSQFGWRESLLMVCILGVGIFILNFFLLQEYVKPSEEAGAFPTVTLREKIHQIGVTLKAPSCWMNGVAALGIYLSASVIADLWGVSFLVQAHGLDKQTAAETVSLIYVGLCIGSLVLTFISDFFKQKKLLIALCTTAILIPMAYVLYAPGISLLAIQVAFFLIGFFSGAEMLCFANALESASTDYAGTVTGFINCIVMLGGGFLQEQVGNLLDLYWDHQYQASGIRLYSAHEFKIALSLVIIVLTLSLLAALLLPGPKKISAQEVVEV